MAFILPLQEYGNGWGAGHRARFEEMANQQPTPMGLLGHSTGGCSMFDGPTFECFAG